MATIIGTSGSDTNLTGTSGSDKINAGAGDDTLIYNVTANKLGTTDIYTGGAGFDTVLLEMSREQWMSYQCEIALYLEHLDTVKTNSIGEVSNGSSSGFTFEFGDSTLTVQMMEVLRVKVDKGDGFGFVDQDLIDDGVTARDDRANGSTDPVIINVLSNDIVPDLVKSLAFANPDLSAQTLTYGTATLEKSGSANASTWYFTYTVDADDAEYIALGGDVNKTDSFVYKVTDADDDEGTASVTITVTGVNDLATISDATPDGVNDDFKGSVTEAGSSNGGGISSASGKLVVADPDNGENVFKAMSGNGTRGYGTFSITAEGAWTYMLDNDNDPVKALNTISEPLKDTFTVSSRDGTATETVTITINGADDAPPPKANNDVLWVTSNTRVTLSPDILLKNDIDFGTGNLVLSGIQDEQGIFSNLILNPDRSFSFDSGAQGGTVSEPTSYTFTYNVLNPLGNWHEPAKVTVNVVAVSHTDSNTVDLSGENYAGAYLAGGSKADTFTGGSGDDVMVGGSGTDVFVQSGGKDMIRDFSVGMFDLLNFEGINASAIPNLYSGLQWENAYVLPKSFFPDTGFAKVVTSGEYGIYNGSGGLAGFSNLGADFDFVSGNFAASLGPLTLTITAYDDGFKVGIATVTVSDTNRFKIDFLNKSVIEGSAIAEFDGGRFTSVDRITWVGPANSGMQIAGDDWLLRYGDKIDVPEDTDIEALINTATSDGAGASVLHFGVDNTLTLTGVPTSVLDASLFV